MGCLILLLFLTESLHLTGYGRFPRPSCPGIRFVSAWVSCPGCIACQPSHLSLSVHFIEAAACFYSHLATSCSARDALLLILVQTWA